MRRVTVPFHLIHVGDVIDRPLGGGSDSFEVITRVGEGTKYSFSGIQARGLGLTAAAWTGWQAPPCRGGRPFGHGYP